ncbi:MAG TPA: DUF4012 domain-containing protein [Ktedonobacterales bacterium]
MDDDNRAYPPPWEETPNQRPQQPEYRPAPTQHPRPGHVPGRPAWDEPTFYEDDPLPRPAQTPEPRLRPPSQPVRPANMTPRPPAQPAGLAQRPASTQRPAKKYSRRRLFMVVLLIFLAVSGVLGIGGYFGLYAPAKQLGNDGAAHLQQAQKLLQDLSFHPLALDTLTKTRNEFSAAEDDFSGVKWRLAVVRPFLGVIGFLTGRSDELDAYVHLANMAFDISSAGHQALDAGIALVQRESNALSLPGGSALGGSGAFSAGPSLPQTANSLGTNDINQVQQTLKTVQGLVDDAWSEAQSIKANALPSTPAIQSAFALFKGAYPSVKELLGAVQQALGAAPQLLGINHATTYLTFWQDTSERRATGGFITAVGTMNVQNGQLGSLALQDTYLLDTPAATSHPTPIPDADSWFTLSKTWGLRDANLEPDFPTAAKAAEQLYTAEGGGAVDGVMAFTTSFLQHILNITGPVQVPELNETIGSDNLVDRLHFYQFTRSSGDEVPTKALAGDKQFSALLITHLVEKLRTLSPDATAAVLQTALQGLPTKDVQLYLNDSRAEQALARAHRAGAVEATSGDELLIVDTNVSPNKADDNIDEVQSDTVILDTQGNANHHVTVAYHWKRTALVYGNSTYIDYVRFYIPASSQVQVSNGFTVLGTGSAYGYTVVSGTFTLVANQTLLLSLSYVVPHAVSEKNGQSSYALLVQKQGGEPLARLKLTITMPPSANLVQHSTNLKLATSGNDILFDQLMDRNVTATVSYNGV